MKKDTVVIVGAGAAGIGMGILLKRLDIPFLIIERDEVGASFSQWAKETKFISPSFSGNAFGVVDLNAVTPDTSPAFSLQSEHPTGEGYARYLSDLARYFELPVYTNTSVDRVEHTPNGEQNFILHTSETTVGTNHLIWATGEYAFPNKDAFTGADQCLHYADVDSWANFEGDSAMIIGAYESGVDAAYQLAKLGKIVTLFDSDNTLTKHGSDSSYTLSPFTRDRFNEVRDRVRVIDAQVNKVYKKDDEFVIEGSDGCSYTSLTQPVNCTGFNGGASQIQELFNFEPGYAELNEFDESTVCPNLFLVGPQVRHGNAIFCFIYKYRQRFGVVAEELSRRLNGDEQLCLDVLDYYRDQNFYLRDLSCCEDDCVC